MNIKSKKGFTLVEIIAAALIITISAAGTFSAYVLARKFSNRFANKSQATKIAAAIADDLRYGHSYEDLVVSASWYDIAPADLDKYNLDTEVVTDSLTARYLVSRAGFVNNGSGNITETSDFNTDGDGDPATSDPSDPPYHKKITVKVGWTEPA